MLLPILLAVSVSVREHVTAKEVTYTYHVTNRTHQRIVAVRIGYDAEHDNPELATLPPRWTFAFVFSVMQDGWGDQSAARGSTTSTYGPARSRP